MLLPQKATTEFWHRGLDLCNFGFTDVMRLPRRKCKFHPLSCELKYPLIEQKLASDEFNWEAEDPIVSHYKQIGKLHI